MITDEKAWAEQLFGGCDLRDARRTQRLIDVGARLSRQTGASLAKCCEGDQAALLGSYRLIGNSEVHPDAIREGGFAQVAQQAQALPVRLAIEDTTRRSYSTLLACLGSVIDTNTSANLSRPSVFMNTPQKDRNYTT
jgi:hypothetical protein